MRELLETILPHSEAFEKYLIEHDFLVIGHYSWEDWETATAPAVNGDNAMSDKEDEITRQQLREKAEARLASAKPTSGQALTGDELLHELRVHQIELEMQNEELRRAHIALETLHAHYVELYDFAPVGYLTLTAEGMIAEINLTGAKLLGVERKRLMNRRFEQFIGDEYKDLWYRHFLHAKQNPGAHGCELPIRHENDIVKYAHLDSLFIDADGKPSHLRVTLADVTERKQAEAELRIAAVAFEAQESILVTDPRRVILRVNKAFTRITGYSAEEAIGKTPAILRSGLHNQAFYDSILDTVAREGHWEGEIWNKRKNIEIFPVLQTITAVRDADGQLTHYVGAMMSMTAQKQAEKVLLEARKRLEHQVATTQEELDKIKADTTEINTALNVLLKHREMDKSSAQAALSNEMNSAILPFLKKLKGSSIDRDQAQLLDILETNLQHLVKTYGRAADLSAAYLKLSPLEMQVASLVRQGLPTKVIATTLNSSPETVNIHRKHIRKKLGLDSKAHNLSAYLKSLTE